MPRRLVAFLAAAILSGLLAAPAGAGSSGPPLSVPQSDLAEALTCKRLAGATRQPILFVPGTGETPQMFDFNWLPYADSRGWPYCVVALPRSSMGDIQVSAEYVTYAIRRMAALTARRVQVVGHSQGGMLPRWSLRFWPDTRALVDDLVGLAPSNHGTDSAIAFCAALQGCPASVWQQRSDSNFMSALNRGAETFAGPSYTVAFTRFDEVVVPNQDAQTGSSALRTGTGARSNIRVQDVCPLDRADHFEMGTTDAAAWAIAVDALEHAGPASAGRIDRASVCLRPVMPGANPATAPADVLRLSLSAGANFVSAPRLSAEPPLKCYVTNSCPARERASARLTITPQRVAARRRTSVTLRGTVVYASGRREVADDGIVAFAGRRIALGSDGVATVSVRFADPGTRRAVLTVPTVGRTTATLRVVRRAGPRPPRPGFTG